MTKRIFALIFTAAALLFDSRAVMSQQTNGFVSIRLSGHMNFRMKVPSMDDAGFGLQLDAALLAKNKLRPLISTHYETLLGDKQYINTNLGRQNKSGTIYGIQAGPEYVVKPGLALTFQYGVYWYAIQTIGFHAHDGYRIGATLIPGKSRRFGIQLSRNEISLPGRNIRYHNFGVGYQVAR